MPPRHRLSRRSFLAGLAGSLSLVACSRPFAGGAGGTPPAASSLTGPTPTPALASPNPSSCTLPTAYMTFAINIHDWCHDDESADTLHRAIDTFERHRVRGDFYLTGEMVNRYLDHRSDIVDRLRASNMTISYHVRPPHPLYDGFQQPLHGLDDDELRQAISDYETYRLDLATGGLIRSEPGGYSLVADTFGSPPVVAGAPTSDRRIKRLALDAYRSAGSQMLVLYHEEGADLDRPFEYAYGLLARPSDFSVTRWRPDDLPVASGDAAKDPFWWNFLDSPYEAALNPTAYLRQRLAEWDAPRPPFVTSLIHENNFPRSGPEAWTPIYWDGGDKSMPNSPPFDLDTPDPSTLRSPAQQEKIWSAYEELVAYAATELSVVTSADIVALAQASGDDGRLAAPC